MDYAVNFGGKPVGRAQMTKKGLYYHVSCRCQLSGDVMYRLEVGCGDAKTNLGLLVPMENGFGLDTRFPVSRIGEGEPTFQLVPRHDILQDRTFVPITPEEPFAYISRLKDAFLETREGVQGASLPHEETGEGVQGANLPHEETGEGVQGASLPSEETGEGQQGASLPREEPGES